MVSSCLLGNCYKKDEIIISSNKKNYINQYDCFNNKPNDKCINKNYSESFNIKNVSNIINVNYLGNGIILNSKSNEELKENNEQKKMFMKNIFNNIKKESFNK